MTDISARILVVDDNPAIHRDFQKIFGASQERPAPSPAEVALFGAEAGDDWSAPVFQIDSAFQGQEGLAMVIGARAQQRPYAMAFVDVRMPPGWDGIETVARLWKADEDIQVVLCTAYSDYSWGDMLAKLGRSDRLVILKKPFDTIEVLQLASALTEKWRLARHARTTLEGLERRVSERTRELVAAGAQLRRHNRIYALMSGINALIVRVRDREELFDETCRIAVEAGGMRMSFIVMKRGPAIVPVASAGKDEALMAAINELLASSRSAETMVARSIATREPLVWNSPDDDSGLLLGAHYAKAGVRSLAVLPLVLAGESVGAMVLYATDTDFFHEEELRLLHNLAADIAHAMDHIGKREQLDYLAYYDALTGLANRRLFLERIAQHLRNIDGPEQRVALFLLDLERFRNINDSLGRGAGDALLQQVSQWLTVRFGDATLLARVGPDHFGVVLPDVRDAGEVARLLEGMLDALAKHPFLIENASFRVAAKVGVTLYPVDGLEAETLHNHAEAALQKAKSRGGNYVFYTQAMSDAVAGRMSLENHLREALANGEFVLHYQPKTSLATGKLTGAEALIRWNDPRTGLVPPVRFIPVLEETGLIHEVGRWALRQALADSLRWSKAGLATVRIGVNVSPLQLRSPDFVGEIERALAAGAHAGASLELEITESLIMEDVRHSGTTLEAIRALGVSIAIDDFGTGFSSLSYLAKLPVDFLKIDRSFIVDMTSGPQGLALVSTIIKLAHTLKIKVAAEGVETEEQKHLLRLLGCDEMQGFLLSKPLPRDDFEARFLAVPATVP